MPRFAVKHRRGYKKGGRLGAFAARTSRTRAAAVRRRRGGVGRSRRGASKRGRRKAAGSSQSVPGAGRYAVKSLKAPAVPALQVALKKLGLPIAEWVHFESHLNWHIQPPSGRCYWGGVPHKLIQGTLLALPTTDTDYMPSNCDLFDAARKLNQGTNDAGSVGYQPFYDAGPKASRQTFGENISGTGGVNAGVVGETVFAKEHVRQLMVAKNEVNVTMENVSSLDAFIEQYELVYTRPDALGQPSLSQSGYPAIVNQWYSIGTHGATIAYDSAADVADTLNTVFLYSTAAMPYYRCVWPEWAMTSSAADIAAGLGKVRNYRHYEMRLAAQLLESYVHICLNHRNNIALFDQTEDLPYTAAGTSVPVPSAVVTTTQRRLSVEEALAHPLNDPTKLWPPAFPNKSGFHLRKLPGLITLKPGSSVKVHLPVSKQFMLDESSFPRIQDSDTDQSSNGANGVYRTVATLPRKVTCRFFRVHGDMVQSTAVGDTLGDHDYQTGSARVQFTTNRSFWMKRIVNYNTKQPDVFNEFPDPQIAIGSQAFQNNAQDALMSGAGAAPIYNIDVLPIPQ